MHAAILGLVDGEVSDPTIESHLEPGSYPAIDAEATKYLDRATVYHGTCANTIDVQTTDVHVGDAIVTEEVTGRDTVACEFYADLDAGFVGVDSSVGEWLFNTLGAMHGVRIGRARLDLDAFASALRAEATASAWHVAASDQSDPDNPRVSIDYHADADFACTDGRETSQLGFQYSWSGTPVRGTVAQSGYVAVYSSWTAETFAKWLREELLEFAELAAEQAELGGEV